VLRGLRLFRQPEAGQCQAREANGEFFQHRPPRDGLGHSLGQFIEFVVHNFPFVLSLRDLLRWWLARQARVAHDCVAFPVVVWSNSLLRAIAPNRSSEWIARETPTATALASADITALPAEVSSWTTASFACLRLVCQPKAGQRQASEGSAEFLKSLPARNRLGQAFGEFIEFIFHNFLFDFVCVVLIVFSFRLDQRAGRV
jgi:hypothetical protein